MRHIGTLKNEPEAMRLVDYLLTLGIQTQVDRESEGFLIWVFEEDRVPQAREVLQLYLENPQDPRFVGAEQLAQKMRAEQLARQESPVVVVDTSPQLTWSERYRMSPVVWSVVLVCVVLAVIDVIVGQDLVFTWLGISQYNTKGSLWKGQLNLHEVADGQIWRLLTPALLHGNLPHLGINMLVFLQLGREIEGRQGSWRLIWMMLVIGVLSNLAQYLYRGPHFVGLSGVVCGLFSYIWIKSLYDRSSGYDMPMSSAIYFLVWITASIFFLSEVIANMAHLAGLLVGAVLSFTPILWNRWRISRHRRDL